MIKKIPDLKVGDIIKTWYGTIEDVYDIPTLNDEGEYIFATTRRGMIEKVSKSTWISRLDLGYETSKNYPNLEIEVIGHTEENGIYPTEFEEKYCKYCGSQRCEGIGTEWFDGCKFRSQLRKEDKSDN